MTTSVVHLASADDEVMSRANRQRNTHRGVEQLVARRAHNPKVAGSSPVPATSSPMHESASGFSFALRLSPLLLVHCSASELQLWAEFMRTFEGIYNHTP